MDELDLFLREDLGEGDITSNALFTQERGEAVIFAKQKGVLAGVVEAKLIFEKLNCGVKKIKKDGERLKKGEKILEITGPMKSIFGGERLALNFLGRMSGIATQVKEMTDKCREINPKVKIAATRKTTPGFRRWEKKAVVIGGGYPHRMGLWDGILIKDTHIAAIGSIENAVKLAKLKVRKLEVEVTNLEEARAVSALNVDVIMLDNFPPSEGEKAAQIIRDVSPDTLIESSGGINAENVGDYAPYSDIISCGFLTHSAKSLDFSLKVVKES